jgi:uncharacterized protein DUF2851
MLIPWVSKSGMTEKLLQYIWQHQYFNKNDLFTDGDTKEPFQIISPGIFNTDQGPDFKEARIKIGPHTWAGNVELHVKASDWQKHKHDDDPNYVSVVLHVVWENDLANTAATDIAVIGPQVSVTDHRAPVFALAHRVSKLLLQQYEEWMMSPSFIPCGSRVNTIPDIVFSKWKERLLVERLEKKAFQIYHLLESSKNHWEEVLWWLLAKNFGITVNRESFELLARSLPLTLIGRHKHQIHQLECLLFGQAGLLSGKFTEAYPLMLKKEYLFLKKKYALKPIFAPIHFLRMRPVNFPTIRLAQLAMLLFTSEHLFSKLLAVERLDELREMFDITANDYWHYHFRFEETTAYQPKKLGQQMIENIIINTVVPIMFAYGHYHKDERSRDRVFHWLDMMHAEKNRITSRFYALGVRSQNAFDTQALYELKTRYCDERRCLDCAVGNSLLKGNGSVNGLTGLQNGMPV